jgi:hypothetical protein
MAPASARVAQILLEHVSDLLPYHDDTMTPSVSGFSWLATLRALVRPSPPPPGLLRTGALLLALSVVVVLALAALGHAWYGNPHRFFGERKVGTYLSFLNLVATGVMAGSIARQLGPRRFARFWWAAAGGFVWLGGDDLFTLHEQIDRGLHALLGLDPEHPVTDHLDDLIVAGYGVAALGLAYRHRADLQPFVWMQRTLGLAFALFAAMVAADMLHTSKALEDGLKVVAGTLIFVGFVAARLELPMAVRVPLGRSPTEAEAVDALR